MATIRQAVEVAAAQDAAYGLVSRVDAYDEVIEDCESVQVLEQSGNETLAELVLGIGKVTGRFRCVEPELVFMQLVSGSWGRLEGTWLFTATGTEKTRIELVLAFKSANLAPDALLRPAVKRVSRRLLASMADALDRRGLA